MNNIFTRAISRRSFAPYGLLLLGLAYLNISAASPATGSSVPNASPPQSKGAVQTPKPELVVQLSHSGGVFAVAFSPDNSLLASSGSDGAVKLWNVKTRELERDLLTSEGNYGDDAPAIAFSPTGRFFISAANYVKLWDVATGRLIRVIKLDAPVQAVAISPDGRFLALSLRDEVQVWSLPKTPSQGFRSSIPPGLQFIRHFTVRNLPSTEASVAFSRDNRLAIGLKGEVHVINAETGQKLRAFTEAGSSQAVSVAFNSKNQLAMGFREVQLWDGKSAASTRKLNNLYASEPGILSFSQDGHKLLVGGEEMALWNLSTSRLERNIDSDISEGSMGVLSPNGKFVASGASFNDYGVQLWSAQTGKLLTTWPGRNGGVNDVAVSKNQRFLATATDDGPLRVWNLATNSMVSVGKADEGLHGVAFAPNSQLVANDRGEVWTLSTGKLFRKFRAATLPYGPQISFLGSKNKTPLEGFGGEIEDIDLSPDGRILAGAATGMNDDSLNAVEIWDKASGKLLRRLVSEGGWVQSVRFTRDGKLLAAGYHDGCIRFWNTSNWKIHRVLPAHAAPINALRLTPDGKHLLSAGNDYQVKIWNPRSGALEATLVILPPKKEFGFSSDWLIYTPTGYYDGTARAEEFLRWRFANRILPATAGRKFRKKNLLSQILKGH